MKHLYVYLILLIIPDVSSQTNRIDSLQEVIKNYPRHDTTYVNLRLEYFRHKVYLTPNDTTWLSYNLKTLQIAKKIKFKRGVILSCQRIGLVYSQLLSDPYRALDYYHEAINLAETDSKFHKYKPDMYIHIGNIYYEQKENRKALKCYNNAIKSSAKDYYHGYSAVANVYGSINKPDSAIFFYKKAIFYSEQKKDYPYLANNLSNISLILNSVGKNEEAKTAIVKSLALVDMHGLEYIRPTAYTNAAMVYAGTKNYKTAEHYALQALSLDVVLNNLFMQKSIWGTLAEIYEFQGKYAKSVSAYKKYMYLTDSITSYDRKIEITRKEMRFEADKKQALAAAEINRQKIIRNSIIGGSSLAGITGVVLFVGYRRRQQALNIQKELLLKARISDTEMKVLRLQLNPHFIFNSLNSIGDYIGKNDIQTADYYLSKFAKLMRGMLENSEEKEIPLADELRMLELYMQLEASRMNNKFTYEIRVQDGINTENTHIPPLILQPFVENSIWHGLAKKEGHGKITIEVTYDNKMLNCIVEDDGVGRDKNTKSSGKSYGMKITKDRIDLLNKLKNANASVHLVDLEKGTRVEVKLPFDEEL